ncbi:uncharacterized protein I303_100932 [Kwoniella dejecticola CBS 10117]|uniref:Uncharacterized protein n=1 Tax=Kwoniella dejecticola CBS 10117 TaxID=1296121 RepID=A0A1A6AGC0_9TREE|nr:uncharacterized protein I303_00936 [Kwoniella dejecticola CBS 10117]OBR89114.1 hypothetical protein I303_00936 [Kwoniella dejecticola CBS 10117]
MSRLDSLTPSKSRSRASPSPSPSLAPNSPSSGKNETTHHRMLKLVLSEVRKIFRVWDELVMIDGCKAAKGCIDEGTEMDNILSIEEKPERPEITSHLNALYNHRQVLESTLKKLDNNLYKLSALADQAEKILFGACSREGNEFVFVDPLWSTWTMKKFVNSLSPLITLHTSHLASLSSLAKVIMDTNTSFDDAKVALESWRDIATAGERWVGVREWEELVDLELEDEMDEEDEVPIKSKKKNRK